jgi:hypothetical protein
MAAEFLIRDRLQPVHQLILELGHGSLPHWLLAGHAVRPPLHDTILQLAGISQCATDPEPEQAQQHKEHERDDGASPAGRLVVEPAIFRVVRPREKPRDEP